MFRDGACGPEMKRVVCRIEADYLGAIYHDLDSPAHKLA